MPPHVLRRCRFHAVNAHVVNEPQLILGPVNVQMPRVTVTGLLRMLDPRKNADPEQ